MHRFKAIILVAILFLFTGTTVTGLLFDTPVDAASGCSSSSSFFGLPTWYAHLPLKMSADNNSCSVVLTNPSDIWIIVLNIIDILLRLTGIAAVLFIIIGGIRYIISQGESAGITAAKQTITRAVVGLVIAIVAILIVTYVSSIFGQKVNANSNYKISAITRENYA